MHLTSTVSLLSELLVLFLLEDASAEMSEGIKVDIQYGGAPSETYRL